MACVTTAGEVNFSSKNAPGVKAVWARGSSKVIKDRMTLIKRNFASSVGSTIRTTWKRMITAQAGVVRL